MSICLIYFGAIGGAGALLAKCIKSAELIAYEDLGAEALMPMQYLLVMWHLLQLEMNAVKRWQL